jgi:hypothetical protein
MSSQATTYRIGQRVEVHSFGRWYAAIVTKLGPKRVTVHYTTGTGLARDKAFAMDRVRALPDALSVALDTRGNPDFGQDPRRPLPGLSRKIVFVKTIREASVACRAFIEANDVGSGNWTGGQVYDTAGAQVAQISYNGRAWKPGPYPQPEIQLEAAS